MLEQGNRKNLFMVFDETLSPQIINNKGNVFDIGPTVLDIMGSDVKGLGLGRNLMHEESLSVKNDIDEIIALNKKRY
jgi:phosphoglycerol transferase